MIIMITRYTFNNENDYFLKRISTIDHKILILKTKNCWVTREATSRRP